jgi:phosphohistidine phosphatase
MTVYFLRHASAGQKRANAQQDDKRPLDKEGIEQCRYVGRLLNALDTHVDLILSSPLKRATQTASFVGNELAYEQKIELAPALKPNAEYQAFRDLLRSLRKFDSVMVVGHNPNFSRFLALMVTNGADDSAIEMKKGGVARVEMGPKRSVLQWIVTPRLVKSAYTSAQDSSLPKISKK